MSGAHAVTLTEVHAKGGEGGEPLAKAVVSAIQDHVAAGRPFTPLFVNDAPIMDKVNGIAQRIYKADGVMVENKAKKQLATIESWGYGHLPVCMAKTQYSFSHDAGQLGAPVGFTIPVREFRLNAGAGFIVAVLGNMMTMPGLPKRPAAADMDMDEAEAINTSTHAPKLNLKGSKPKVKGKATKNAAKAMASAMNHKY